MFFYYFATSILCHHGVKFFRFGACCHCQKMQKIRPKIFWPWVLRSLKMSCLPDTMISSKFNIFWPTTFDHFLHLRCQPLLPSSQTWFRHSQNFIQDHGVCSLPVFRKKWTGDPSRKRRHPKWVDSSDYTCEVVSIGVLKGGASLEDRHEKSSPRVHHTTELQSSYLNHEDPTVLSSKHTDHNSLHFKLTNFFLIYAFFQFFQSSSLI